MEKEEILMPADRLHIELQDLKAAGAEWSALLPVIHSGSAPMVGLSGWSSAQAVQEVHTQIGVARQVFTRRLENTITGLGKSAVAYERQEADSVARLGDFR